jgi:hypothetical protein
VRSFFPCRRLTPTTSLAPSLISSGLDRAREQLGRLGATDGAAWAGDKAMKRIAVAYCTDCLLIGCVGHWESGGRGPAAVGARGTASTGERARGFSACVLRASSAGVSCGGLLFTAVENPRPRLSSVRTVVSTPPPSLALSCTHRAQKSGTCVHILKTDTEN